MSTVVGQTRVNGGADQGLTGSHPNGVAKGQFLTGRLAFFELNTTDTDVSDFGFHANGVAKAGEVVVLALSSVANPVILEASGADANVIFFATEVPGVSAAIIEDTVQAAGFANATVAEGSFTVVV